VVVVVVVVEAVTVAPVCRPHHLEWCTAAVVVVEGVFMGVLG
jgi:hypothetical protein